MQKYNKHNRKLGFTLMELLGVVAIMTVLFALGVPATKTIMDRLDWKKANGIAKEIYMVANNQAIHVKSNNSLDSLEEAFISASSKSMMKVTAAPIDYPKDSTTKKAKETYKNLYCFSGDATGPISYLIPKVTRDTIDGGYIVEANPATGDIYSIFFSEDLTSSQLFAAYKENTKNKVDNFRYTDKNGKIKVIEWEDDKGNEVKVGYISSNDSAGLSMEGNEVKMTAYNDEQLYVKVKIPGAKYATAFAASGESNSSDFKVEFILMDEHGHKIIRSGTSANVASTDINKPIFVQNTGVDTGDVAGSVDAYLILDDSLNSTQTKFAKLNKGLTPGDDITIYAQACYIYTDPFSHEKKYLTTQLDSTTNAVTVNSLFADGTEISDDPAKTTTIKVSNCRQFRNIENFRSDSAWASTVEGRNLRVNQKVVIDQTSDINFAKLQSQSSVDAEVCPAMSVNGRSGACDYSFTASDVYNKLENIFVLGTNVANWEDNSGVKTAYCNTNNVYDGHGNEISNIVIESTAGTGSGLFGKFGCICRDVHVRNIKVRSVNAPATGEPRHSCVGGLIGYAGPSAKVIGCGVYCAAKKEEASFTEYSFDRITLGNTYNRSNYYIEGWNAVGGLVGQMEGGALIINSFAAIDVRVDYNQALLDTAAVDSYNSFGGLVGRMSSSSGKILNCYSSGKVQGTYDVGGIVGVCYGQVNNCYSTSIITPTRAYDGANNYCAGGLTGKLCGKLKNSIFYGTFEAYRGTVDWTETSCGACADRKRTDDQKDRKVSNCKCLQLNGYSVKFSSSANSLGSKGYDGTTQCKYSVLVSGVSNTAANSYPYDAKNEGLTVFPFKFSTAMISSTYAIPDSDIVKYHDDASYRKYEMNYHYGDWPEEKPPCSLVYYEKYKKGSTNTIGYYSLGVKTEEGESVQLSSKLKDSLDEGEYVVEAGYAIVLLEGDTVGLNGTKTKLETPIEKNVKLKDGVNVDIYALPAEYQDYSLEDGSGKKFYKSLSVNDDTYYYNPCVAKAIATEDGTPGSAEIRTAKQFYNLGYHNGFWGKFGSTQVSYLQTLDIDYSTYDGASALTNKPIGTVSIPFANNYNGGGNTIKGYNLEVTVNSNSVDETGPFGRIYSSTLSGIHLVGNGNTITGYFDGTISDDCIVLGGLVGYSKESSISNCSVSGYNILAKFTGSQHYETAALVGGIAGSSNGNITNCSAVNKKLSVETAGMANNSNKNIRISIAGITACRMSGALSNCYAGGNIVFNNDSNKGVFAYLSGIANGTMPGVYSASTTDPVSNCYSYCNITSNYKNAYTFGCCPTSSSAPKIGGEYRSLCVINNCNYLKGSSTYDYSGGTEKTYAELVKLADTKADADHSFPWVATTPKKAYPFKAVLSDDYGDYVHYGDWPEGPAGPSGLIGMVRKHDPYKREDQNKKTHYDVCYIRLVDGEITEAFNDNNLKKIPDYAKNVNFKNNYLAVFWNLPADTVLQYKTGAAIYSYQSTSGTSGVAYYPLANEGMTQSLILNIDGREVRDSRAYIVDGGHSFN